MQPAVLSSPPYADPVVGSGSETFGPYRLDALIGRGGMGEVYRATDLVKNRVVALKRLPPQLATDPEVQDRFRREAEMTAGLREPHVIPIHDYGEIDGRLYIDMRLVEGMDLAEVLARHGPLPPSRAVDIITQVAAALDAAHADGLVHRDVKPSNVLISTHNHTADYVYLVDFGIAHAAAATRLTVTGSTIGTVAYIAPERLVSDHWDHRVDVYAVGCVLSEMLTGQKPFPVSDAQAQVFAHLTGGAANEQIHREGQHSIVKRGQPDIFSPVPDVRLRREQKEEAFRRRRTACNQHDRNQRIVPEHALVQPADHAPDQCPADNQPAEPARRRCRQRRMKQPREKSQHRAAVGIAE